MIAGIARMKSSLVFAGLALTLITSAGMPMLGSQDAMAKHHKHHGSGHSQVQRDHKDNHKGQRDQDKQAKGGKHCVANLDVASGEVTESCYRTFEQAQAAARSGGTDAQGRNYQDAVLAILYASTNYNDEDGSWTLTGTGGASGCTLGDSFSFNEIGGFNNRTLSAQVFSGCKATFFTDSFLSGDAKTGSIVNGYDIPNMESFNYRISSVRLSKG